VPLLLALSLSGCATTWQPAVTPAKSPPPAAELMTPTPPGEWSANVQALLHKWRQLLTPAKPD
jgi:hypothetical protein